MSVSDNHALISNIVQKI